MNLEKRRFLFAIILTFFLSSFSFAQTKDDAKLTVEKFYKFYRTRNGLMSTHELNLIKPWFTIELTKLFQNEIKREVEFSKKNWNEKPHFGDGFPFNPYDECVNDGKVVLNNIEISEVTIDVTKAMVEVKFSQPKECDDSEYIDTYKIELLKSKNRWLINDWIYQDDTKLTDDLKRKDY
jgi:hypothetical protein